MKRQTNLMTQIADYDNLLLAFYKARKSKTTQHDVLTYEASLDEKLEMLRSELVSGNVKVGNYHFFTISDPKVRQICAAPFSERVMHHAIMNVCHKRFEQHLTDDTYATRKGKGTYAALERARYYTRKYNWFVKLDIRKYFDSIDHAAMKEQLMRLFNDKILLRLFNVIIDSYQTAPKKGLPIGNLTSQYFANQYLSDADHFAREKLKIKGYVRYMDDMLLFGDDKAELLLCAKRFVSFVQEMLKLQFKPVVHHRTSAGVPFLGYKLFPFTVKLNRRSKKRFKAKMKIYEGNLTRREWNVKIYRQHVEPLVAFTQYAQAKGFRKHVLKSLSQG